VGGGGLGQQIHKAVITVPAYFSDAQRQATGRQLSWRGLEAFASSTSDSGELAYGAGVAQSALVYDLGGGTFDVSIVALEMRSPRCWPATATTASRGRLQRSAGRASGVIVSEAHGIDLRHGHPVAEATSLVGGGKAKKRLSAEPRFTVREEALVSRMESRCT